MGFVIWGSKSKVNTLFKCSHRRCSIKKAFLRNFAIFTGKHLCRSLFLIKLQVFRSPTLLTRDSRQLLSCEYCEIFIKYLFWETSTNGCFWNVKCGSEVTKTFRCQRVHTNNPLYVQSSKYIYFLRKWLWYACF